VSSPLRTPTADPPAAAHRWRALSVCLVALFATLLDVSVTNVALPAIGQATGAGPSQLQWVVSGYVLAFGLVPVIGGRLGDDRGRRTMFLIGVGGFVVTSALVGVAPGPGVLVAARVLQGLFGGLINPQVSGLVQQLFRGAERGRAFGAIGAVVGTATAVGPVLGGLLIGLGGPQWGWRLVFFVNVPVGVVAMVLAWRWLPAPQRRVGPRHRLDVPGALLLGLATFCVLFPTVQYDAVRDARLFWVLAPAVPLGIAFVVRERRLTRLQADPLVDLRLFSRPSYTVGVCLALLYFCGYTGLPLVLSLYLQLGHGLDALHAGLAVTSFAAGSAVAAPVAGRLVPRVGRPLVVVALVVFGAGALAVALVVRGDPDDVALRLALPLLLLGVGSGAIITPNQALSLQDVDPRMGGAAGGVLQTAQRIGSAIGQAVIGAVFFASLGGTPPPGSPAYGPALAASVVVTLAFVAAALLLGVTDIALTRRRSRADSAA
jgi:EmrB/QacA subfamily drug resistance transporter